jgi:hypothetical protein
MMAAMDDPRTADGVEHLQAAARELLLAARSFLDVVEEVVEDRDRLAGAASGVIDLLRDGLSGAVGASSPLEPWEQAAWAGGTGDHAGTDEHAGADDGTAEDSVGTDDATADDSAAAAPPTRRRRPSSSAAGDGPPRRVRRIAVD